MSIREFLTDMGIDCSMSEKKFIRIEVPQEVIESAYEKAEYLGSFKDSIEEGRGTAAAFIAEWAVNQYTGYVPSEKDEIYQYDQIRKDGKVSSDTKAKRCTTPPRIDFECSVANFNIKQKCTIYTFARVFVAKGNTDKLLGTVWLMGWLPKKEYFRIAWFRPKRHVDRTNNNVCSANCWNVDNKDILPMEILKKFESLDKSQIDEWSRMEDDDYKALNLKKKKSREELASYLFPEVGSRWRIDDKEISGQPIVTVTKVNEEPESLIVYFKYKDEEGKWHKGWQMGFWEWREVVTPIEEEAG